MEEYGSGSYELGDKRLTMLRKRNQLLFSSSLFQILYVQYAIYISLHRTEVGSIIPYFLSEKIEVY